MDIVLALVAALLFAVGTVLLQRAGMDEPAGGSDSGLLLRMASADPRWVPASRTRGSGAERTARIQSATNSASSGAMNCDEQR